MSALLRYDAMCRSIAEAHAVDEVKDIRDRAVALEAYARQANNLEAEHHAAEIRVRAERRCGELLKGMPRNVAGRLKKDDINFPERRENFGEKLTELGISTQRASEWQKLADVSAEEFEQVLAEPDKPSASRIINRVTCLTGNNEWFTPAEYLDLARIALGAIDLDPASNSVAQATVAASQFFTEADDGLTRSWRGRVWLNPPYAQPLIEQFVAKLVAELDAGRVVAAVLLTNNSADTSWFQKAAGRANALCLTRGRIRFVSPQGVSGSPTQGQTFFYFGASRLAFETAFRPVGLIVEAVKQ